MTTQISENLPLPVKNIINISDTNIAYNIPTEPGTVNQVLSIDAFGNSEWVDTSLAENAVPNVPASGILNIGSTDNSVTIDAGPGNDINIGGGDEVVNINGAITLKYNNVAIPSGGSPNEYHITLTDALYLIEINDTAITKVYLPPAKSIGGRTYIISNGHGSDLTVYPDGTDTIDGNLSIPLVFLDQRMKLISSGDNSPNPDKWLLI